MWANHIFHLRLPALVYLRSHHGDVLSYYTNFILFTGGNIFILLENSSSKNIYIRNIYTRKNIFPNLVLPGVRELFLFYISLSQKWMELKARLEVAERGTVWGMAAPWPSEVSVPYVPMRELWQIPLFQLWLGKGCCPKAREERCENWGDFRKIIPFSHTTAFLSQVPDSIYQGKTKYLILRENKALKSSNGSFKNSGQKIKARRARGISFLSVHSAVRNGISRIHRTTLLERKKRQKGLKSISFLC